MCGEKSESSQLNTPEKKAYKADRSTGSEFKASDDAVSSNSSKFDVGTRKKRDHLQFSNEEKSLYEGNTERLPLKTQLDQLLNNKWQMTQVDRIDSQVSHLSIIWQAHKSSNPEATCSFLALYRINE